MNHEPNFDFKRLEDLKKGDKFYITFIGERKKAKVLHNNPNDKTIYIKFGWFMEVLLHYDDYEFKDFDLFNNY